MSETNIHTGVYEQIINRLFKLKLNEVDAGRFYIGKKLISKDDAVHILSKYLQHLIEVAFAGTPDDQDADKYTDFVNSVIKTLGREFNVDDTELDLIDAQKSILTAVVDRTNCEYPDIEQHLKAITPTTSLSRSALFFGGKGPADMESELNREILCADEICWVVSFIMSHYLDKDFKSDYLEIPASVRSEAYYVKMMVAWFFATALAKQWDATLPYIEQKRLARWTHNKTIQKAIDSYRITPEQKEYLRTLKIK